MRRRVHVGTLVPLLVLLAQPAAASSVAVLNFGGGDGSRVRATLVDKLSARYDIVDGDSSLQMAESLGIKLSPGPDLVKLAGHLGVVGFVAGSANAGQAALAVFSARNGTVVSSGAVGYRRRLSGTSLRKALVIVLKGLKRCPRRPPRNPRPRPKPIPNPQPEPEPEPSEPGLVFEPDPVTPGGGDTPATTDLGAPSGGADDTPKLGDENPLAGNNEPKQADNGVSKASAWTGGPRVRGSIGLGTWMRSLRINQPDPTFPAPKYDSGAAFALNVGLWSRPLAYFTSGLLSNIYSRLHYQTMLGLQSRNKGKDAEGNEVEDTFSTSLWELCWEVVGYDLKILDSPQSPHAELGLGFGLSRFSINWGELVDRPMPDSGYTFFLAALGAYMPFTTIAGVEITGRLHFDYRVVTGSGEIAQQEWYGKASIGGMNLGLGLSGSYKSFSAGVEYAYTRYFYSFDEAETRINECQASAATCQRAAGGALDLMHAVLLRLGYGF